MAEFGKRLQSLRRQAGLSQAGLARKSGISIRTIQEYEQQRRRPSIDVAERLAAALGVPLDAFAGSRKKKRGKR